MFPGKAIIGRYFTVQKLTVCKDQELKRSEPISSPKNNKKKPPKKRELTKITNSQNTKKTYGQASERPLLCLCNKQTVDTVSLLDVGTHLSVLSILHYITCAQFGSHKFFVVSIFCSFIRLLSNGFWYRLYDTSNKLSDKLHNRKDNHYHHSFAPITFFYSRLTNYIFRAKEINMKTKTASTKICTSLIEGNKATQINVFQ